MVSAAAFRIRFGQDDAVAGDLVDRSDMLVILADHFHMLADLAQQPAFLLAAFAPAAEIALELRLPLAAIIVIVPIEFAELAIAPGAVVRVFVARPVGLVAGPDAACAAVQVAVPFAVGPAIISGDRAIVAIAL